MAVVSVVRRSCSWCSVMNVVGSTVRGVPIVSPVRCGSCGHRADVCRAECDCPVCDHHRQMAAGLAALEADVAHVVEHGALAPGGSPPC